MGLTRWGSHHERLVVSDLEGEDLDFFRDIMPAFVGKERT
jgi:hypothetical protein